MKRIIIHSWAIIIIVIVSSCTSKNLVSTMIERQIKVNVPPEYIHEKEGIVVVTVGTGTPLPGERAQTGTAIFVNGYFFMF
jgi:hypothetical protein